jgi:hypothetical protein
MMERVRDSSGQSRWILGPIEMAVASLVPVILLSIMAWLGSRFASNLDAQGQAIYELSTQQAVTNTQLATLTQQLADVPSLTREVAELKVQVQRNSSDLEALRGDR